MVDKEPAETPSVESDESSQVNQLDQQLKGENFFNQIKTIDPMLPSLVPKLNVCNVRYCGERSLITR